jgi:hypothetical protein
VQRVESRPHLTSRMRGRWPEAGKSSLNPRHPLHKHGRVGHYDWARAAFSTWRAVAEGRRGGSVLSIRRAHGVTSIVAKKKGGISPAAALPSSATRCSRAWCEVRRGRGRARGLSSEPQHKFQNHPPGCHLSLSTVCSFLIASPACAGQSERLRSIGGYVSTDSVSASERESTAHQRRGVRLWKTGSGLEGGAHLEPVVGHVHRCPPLFRY